MLGYELGGFVYDRPQIEDTPERIISDIQAQAEFSSFTDQLKPLVSAWAPDKWRPYLENPFLDEESRTALDGLRIAISYLSASNSDPLPVAMLKEKQNVGYEALIGDLSTNRGLESWQRKNSRGVMTHSVVLFISKNRHHIVFGDQSGLKNIDASPRPNESEIPIDWFDYLPHIDGTTDYTVRHRGLQKIIIGDAVRPVLRQHGLQHTWEHFLISTHR
jgi:hypothetical protein